MAACTMVNLVRTQDVPITLDENLSTIGTVGTLRRGIMTVSGVHMLETRLKRNGSGTP